MSEEVQAAILLTLGALAVRLGLTDAHLAYIRPSMGPVLAVAGAVLVILGGTVLLGPRRRDGRMTGITDGDHVHDRPSRVAWLLLVPVLAIAVIVPRPLGAFAAARAAANRPAPTGAEVGPLPAPASPGAPIDLPLTQFVGRAVHGQGRSLRGATVRLTGFVGLDRRGGGFLLTRFVLACCAADARPVRVAIRGLEGPWPTPDSWVEVIGTWRPEKRGPEDDRPPVLDARSLRPITPPANAYLR
jgi:uncharacterized repeat protein (TIGR03943 family)